MGRYSLGFAVALATAMMGGERSLSFGVPSPEYRRTPYRPPESDHELHMNRANAKRARKAAILTSFFERGAYGRAV